MVTAYVVSHLSIYLIEPNANMIALGIVNKSLLRLQPFNPPLLLCLKSISYLQLNEFSRLCSF